MTYEIETGDFQGPLELLYELIKKNKIEISSISLAEIAEQYLDYIEKMEVINLNNASEFMVIASELIAIKARELLPRASQEEDSEEEDKNLVERLEKYKVFREIALWLKNAENESGQRFFGSAVIEIEPQLELQHEPQDLKAAYERALQASGENEEDEIGTREQINYIKEDNIKMEDKIEEIFYKIEDNNGKLEFSQLIKDRSNYMEVVVTLLGLLELMRLDEIEVVQSGLFERIIVYEKG